MICEKCSHDNSKAAPRDPWCMYQVKDGQVINQLFDPLAIPDGWYDSPKAAKAATVKVKRTRRTPEQMKADKVKADDNSAGTNRQLSQAGGNIS